eukprot:4824066-Alexandrium_andersonii.AAC.1
MCIRDSAWARDRREGMRIDALRKERELRWYISHRNYWRSRKRDWDCDRDHAAWYADEAVRCR